MKVRLVFLLFISLSWNIKVSAQQLLTTKSGQKVLLQNDGSWTVENKDVVLNENGELIASSSTSVNVFEIPQEESIKITPAQKEDITTLKSELEQMEIEYLLKVLKSQEVKSALQDSKKMLPEAEQEKLALRISNESATIKEQKKLYENASKYIGKLKGLLSKSNKNVDKKLLSIQKEVAEKFALTPEVNAQVAAQSVTERVKSYPTTITISESKGPKQPYECELTFDGKDSVSGKNKREVKGVNLFSFTQEKLKPYFKEDDFLNCESVLTKVGKNYYVTLNITVKSKDATRTYGMVKADEEVRIEFIDGTKIYGTNILQAPGEIEAYTGHTLYSIVYKFDKDEIDMLGKKLVDNIGILWSSGFEEYDVYNVDFLKQQVKCLKKG